MVKSMENVRMEDWLSQACESQKTKASYTWLFSNFTEFSKTRGKDVETLVDAWREAKRNGERDKDAFLEEWQDIIRSYATTLRLKFAPITVKNCLTALKSFLKYWDVPLKVELPKHSYVVYHNRDIKKEELKRILTFASARDRVVWLVMAESGMRANNAVNLKYGQIKEDFEAARVPMRILLPSSSLKDHVGDRFTFIGYEGYRELANYLHGKTLKPDDYVFASERLGQCKGEQFSPGSLSVKFNRIVQKLGVDHSRGKREEVGRPKPKEIRLHGLRKYFRNNHGADSSYIEFWLGHSLGVDNHYITRDVEQHRRKYAEGYDSLRVFEDIGGSDVVADLKSRVEQLERENMTLKNTAASEDTRKLEIIRDLQARMEATEAQLRKMQDMVKQALERR
jgi:integrase